MGKDTEVRNITVQEENVSCRVALWRDKAQSDFKTGDYLEITNVVTSTFLDKMYLSTTQNSEIKVCGQKFNKQWSKYNYHLTM